MNINYRRLIFLYKYNVLMLIGWIAITCAAYVLLIRNIPALSDFPFFVLLYIFAVIIIYYFAVLYQIKALTDKIHRLLFTDCDPQSYNTFYEAIISELERMRVRPRLMYFYINLSAGLAPAGRYKDALEVLDKCKFSTNDHLGKLMNAAYYNNALSAYLELDMVKEAENALDYFIKSMAVLRRSDYKKLERYLKVAQYSVNMAQGNYYYTEKVFTEAFETSENNYQRVNSKFSLAKVYLHSGDAVRAKEALEYVIAHGNKLHMVEEARERLKQF